MTKRPHSPVTVVLLDYNGGALVHRCIRSLAAQEMLPARVVFVDNGSREYDEAALRKEFGARYESILEFIRIEHNVGYVKGMNKGLRSVLRDHHAPEWVMTLSNDTELDPHFFAKLATATEALTHAVVPGHPVGMLAPKVRAMDRRDHLDGTGIAVSLDGMSTARGQRERDESQYDYKTHVLIPNGVSALYSVRALRDVGLLDESFGAYCEDTDLGLRAWFAGWDCRFVPECVVYHARSSTHGEHSLNKLYLVERNHYWVAVKNLPLPLLALNPVFSVYRYLVQVYAILASHGHQGRGYGKYGAHELAFATLRGIFAAGLGTPAALGRRFRLRRLKRRSTFEALSALWEKRLRFNELILK
jgi:GT2 family glycosyltransferase